MRILRESEERVEIALAPLIDMVFLLLIFFLVATQFTDPERDQQTKLAVAEGGVAARKGADQVVINIRKGGVFVVDGRILTIDQIETRLLDAAKRNPKTAVRIRGDALTYHKHVVRIIEACHKAKLVPRIATKARR